MKNLDLSELIKKQQENPNIQLMSFYFYYKINEKKLEDTIKKHYNKYDLRFLATNYINLFNYLYKADYKYSEKDILILKFTEFSKLFTDVEKYLIKKKLNF